MQLAFKPAGGAGNYTPLFDVNAITDVGDGAQTPGANPAWETNFAGQNQNDNVFTLPGGKAPKFKRQLGNIAGQISFDVVVAYASFANALAAVRVWANLFETATTVHFRLTEGAEVQYYPNAVIDRVTSKLATGISVRHAVTFTSDLVTTAAPT